MRFDPTKVFALAAVMSGAAWAVGFISLNGGWGAPRWDLIGLTSVFLIVGSLVLWTAPSLGGLVPRLGALWVLGAFLLLVALAPVGTGPALFAVASLYATIGFALWLVIPGVAVWVMWLRRRTSVRTPRRDCQGE